jgi:putative SOS response-associated peptidase YedK
MSVGIFKDVIFPGPDYNVTPDSMQPVIRRNREPGERELVRMHWGYRSLVC